jgi:aromatic ring-opening dioxygenase catalytic subunit (LigB family)
MGRRPYDPLKAYFTGLLSTLPQRPRAILIVSAHWEEALPTVSVATAPEMLYDYYGFPAHTYELAYPAPGAPDVAAHVRTLLAEANIETASDSQRGFDHGVFVPMLIIDPAATLPVAMLSMQASLDPARHLAIGRALAPLRDEGVLIIGSGSSFHNMSTFFDGQEHGSAAFDAWLHETVAHVNPAARSARLAAWAGAPGALESHPRPDHLIPLMIAAGAAGQDAGHRTFRDVINGKPFSCFSFGPT